jgi:hypothetical protein
MYCHVLNDPTTLSSLLIVPMALLIAGRRCALVSQLLGDGADVGYSQSHDSQREGNMRQKHLVAIVGALMTIGSVLGYWAISSGAKDSRDRITIPPTTVADYVHAVLEAHRTFYTIHIVERLQAKGVVTATENWRTANTLPLPAQFFRESAELATKTGTKIEYRLISLWPINKQNGPADDFERDGLKDVLTNQDRAYTGIVTREGERFFRAVYADRAVSQACIGCHNVHPNSPKRDFKANDVMGGMVISIPLGP